MISSLQVLEKVGASLIGSAQFSLRFPIVEIGKSAPCIINDEDVEALLRCNFLDPSIPTEFNLLSTSRIQKKLWKYANLEEDNPEYLASVDITANRPSIGYLPPECLVKPNEKAIKALKNTGPIGEIVSQIRRKTDKKFWEEITRIKLEGQPLYEHWIRELLENLLLLRGTLIACPVPVLTKEYKSSIAEQAKANIDISDNWEELCGRRYREHGCLYSFHLAPNALDEPSLIRKAIMSLNEIFSERDNNFWGVHIHFTDISGVSRKQERVGVAKDIVKKVSDIAMRYNKFTIVSDVGPIGIAFLDQGAAYVTYSLAMTPRKKYLMGMNPNVDIDLLTYGKVLDLWSYKLLSYNEVKKRGYKISDTQLYTNVVPLNCRNKKRLYRINFAKPNNVAVMEKLNNLRAVELNREKNPNPGLIHIRRSEDSSIRIWG